MTELSRDPAAKHLQTVQQICAGFPGGDVAAILAVLSPDDEWGEPENPFNPAAGTRHGHAGFLEWLQVGKRSEDILTLEPHQFLTNDDSVAVVGHTKCLAKATGRWYETDFVHLITFKDNKVTRFQEFFDTYAAGEAFRAE